MNSTQNDAQRQTRRQSERRPESRARGLEGKVVKDVTLYYMKNVIDTAGTSSAPTFPPPLALLLLALVGIRRTPSCFEYRRARRLCGRRRRVREAAKCTVEVIVPREVVPLSRCTRKPAAPQQQPPP